MTTTHKKITVTGRKVDGSNLDFTFGMTVFKKAHAISKGGLMKGFGAEWSGIKGEKLAWASTIQHVVAGAIRKEFAYRGGNIVVGPIYTIEDF